MKAEPKYKPCPFCGSKDIGTTWDCGHMVCRECLATGPFSMGLADARDNWNWRARKRK